MRAVIHSPFLDQERRCAVIAAGAGYEAIVAGKLQDMASLLFRDPDAIGILCTAGATSAAMTIRHYRLAGINSRIVVLIDQAGHSDECAGDRATVLRAGADDAQPVNIDASELRARLIALDQRTREPKAALIAIPGGFFDAGNSALFGAGSHVHLTRLESVVLEAIAIRPRACVTKAACMLALYDGRDEADIKIVDVAVCKIRRKLAPVTGGLDVIETVWGQGYRFIPEGFAPVLSDARKRASA